MSALFFILSCLVAGVFSVNETTVSVYYESLCSDSIAFFRNKLIPTYTQNDFNFSNITSKLEIIPAGKVTKENNGSYTCQHGPSECEGNKVHACAIRYIADQKSLLNYIGCLMNASTPSNKTIPYPSPDVCKNEAGSALANITKCYTSDDGKEGMDLFITYEESTTKFFGNNNISVPFVAFNNKYDAQLSKSATNDFRKTLCGQVGLNDDHCSDSKNGSAMLSAPFALISALFLFFYAAQ